MCKEPYHFGVKGNFKVWRVGLWCPFKTDHGVLLQNWLRRIGNRTQTGQSRVLNNFKLRSCRWIVIHWIAFWGLVQRVSGKVGGLKWKWQRNPPIGTGLPVELERIETHWKKRKKENWWKWQRRKQTEMYREKQRGQHDKLRLHILAITLSLNHWYVNWAVCGI